MVTLNKKTEKFPDRKSPAMMQECGNKENEDKYDNHTETNLVTMDKETEKFPDMTSTTVMEEYDNNECNDNDVNEAYANINDMNQIKGK